MGVAIFRDEADGGVLLEPAGELGEALVIEMEEFDADARAG